MNCDSVFQILTAGPFPTGSAEDEAVEYHISRCQSCRMFSEALRPAPELFHESLDSSNSELPIYHSLPVLKGCGVAESKDVSNNVQNGSQNVSLGYQIPREMNRYSWPSQVVLSEPLFKRDLLAILSFLGVLSCALFGIGWVTAG